MAKGALIKLAIELFFRVEKAIGRKQIQKNLQSMGYSLKDAQKIVNAHRKALLMCKDLDKTI